MSWGHLADTRVTHAEQLLPLGPSPFLTLAFPCQQLRLLSEAKYIVCLFLICVRNDTGPERFC